MADKKKWDYELSSEALDDYYANGYQSPYKSQIDTTLSEINKSKFNYDAGTDPTYAQYKKSYSENGRRAMADTQAKSAALTGGYGNSYGQVAGQAVYNDYMSALADKIPELENNAYKRYQNEQSERYNRLSALLNLDNTDYSRWNDEYSKLVDDYNRKSAERSYQYQLGRDEISDNRYEDETAYSRANAGTSSSTSKSSISSGDEDIYEYELSEKGFEKQIEIANKATNNQAIYNQMEGLYNSGYSMDSIYELLTRIGITNPSQFISSGGTKGGLSFNTGGTKIKSRYTGLQEY